MKLSSTATGAFEKVDAGPLMQLSEGSALIQPGPLFQKIIYDNQIRSGLREVVGSFSENLTAITERVGTLSEGYRKYSCDSFQNMIQNALQTPRNSRRGLFFTGKHNLCPVQVLHFGVHNATRVPVMFRVY